MQSLYDDRNFPATLSHHDRSTTMEQPGREDRLNAWIATERAARARLGASGTLELAQVAALSPQEFFDRIGSGQLPCPPYGELVDFVPIEWSEGRFLFQGTPDRRHYNPLGSVHGGYAASLLDSCMGCAIHTPAPGRPGLYHHRPADQLPARADRQGRPGARRRPGGAPRPLDGGRRGPVVRCRRPSLRRRLDHLPGPAHGRMNAASPGKAARR